MSRQRAFCGKTVRGHLSMLHHRQPQPAELRTCSTVRRALLMPACPSSARRQAARSDLLLAFWEWDCTVRHSSFRKRSYARDCCKACCLANAMDSLRLHAATPTFVLCWPACILRLAATCLQLPHGLSMHSSSSLPLRHLSLQLAAPALRPQQAALQLLGQGLGCLSRLLCSHPAG